MEQVRVRCSEALFKVPDVVKVVVLGVALVLIVVSGLNALATTPYHRNMYSSVPSEVSRKFERQRIGSSRSNEQKEQDERH